MDQVTTIDPTTGDPAIMDVQAAATGGVAPQIQAAPGPPPRRR